MYDLIDHTFFIYREIIFKEDVFSFAKIEAQAKQTIFIDPLLNCDVLLHNHEYVCPVVPTKQSHSIINPSLIRIEIEVQANDENVGVRTFEHDLIDNADIQMAQPE